MIWVGCDHDTLCMCVCLYVIVKEQKKYSKRKKKFFKKGTKEKATASLKGTLEPGPKLSRVALL